MSKKHSKKSKVTVNNVVLHTVGILLVLTMLSVWLTCGLYAKYIVSENFEDSATVQKTGNSNIELLEHKAVLIEDADKAVQLDSVYELSNEETETNDYKFVLPGVDIPKDPFARITGSAVTSDQPLLSYNLYIKVVEENIPATVSYDISADWELVGKEGTTSTYKYKKDIASNFSGTIYILKDNKIMVSDKYVGNGKSFSLSFDAWLKQIPQK